MISESELYTALQNFSRFNTDFLDSCFLKSFLYKIEYMT
jgi:hypothetical protein